MLEFMKAVDTPDLKTMDRALAALWFSGLHGENGLSASEICRLIEQSGHPEQNVTRLAAKMAADKRASRVPGGSTWRLHPRARTHFDELYGHRSGAKPKPKASDSVIPRDLFTGTRGYLEKVVYQINASFDQSLFDCCAVMCRRLLETLIIEVYEADGRASLIKGAGGNFYMFSDLLRILLGDSTFNLSRNAVRGLNDFKRLGDLSAHNRRYNALLADIAGVKDSLRVASEELLHLAKLK